MASEQVIERVQGIFRSRVEGQFHYWNFHDAVDEKKSYFVVCGFEPTIQVVIYDLEIERTNWDRVFLENNPLYRIKNFIGTKRCPWSRRLAAIINCHGYREGETFREYWRRGDYPIPYTPLFRAWLYWDRYLQLIHQCDQPPIAAGDPVFYADCDRKNFKYSEFTPHLQGDLVRVEDRPIYTYIQELKTTMKIVGKWAVSDDELYLYHRQEVTEEKDLQPKKHLFERDEDTGLFGFVPVRRIVLKPDEPVDEHVDKLEEWTNQPSQPRDLFFRSVSLIRKKQPYMRLLLPNELDTPDYIRTLCKERMLKKVLIVFDRWSIKRSNYESNNYIAPYRAVTRRDGTGTIEWVSRTKNTPYLVRTSNGQMVTFRDFMQEYRSVQTISLEEIKHITKTTCDAVFIFGSMCMRKRWLQWLDRCCGENTVIVLIGEIGKAF